MGLASLMMRADTVDLLAWRQVAALDAMSGATVPTVDLNVWDAPRLFCHHAPTIITLPHDGGSVDEFRCRAEGCGAVLSHEHWFDHGFDEERGCLIVGEVVVVGDLVLLVCSVCGINHDVGLHCEVRLGR